MFVAVGSTRVGSLSTVGDAAGLAAGLAWNLSVTVGTSGSAPSIGTSTTSTKTLSGASVKGCIVSDWWDEAEYEADDWGERSSAILRLTKLISESKFLTDRQKRVLYGVYVFSEKRKDIAEDLGVSMKTVQRDHKDALKLLGLVKGRGLLDKEES
jgi:hypothetical protein